MSSPSTWCSRLLPGTIILVKFLLKLLIDRQVDMPEFISGILALPYDIAFLASTLLAGLIIVDTGNVKLGLGLLIASIVVGILAVFLWRRSESYFDKDRYVLTALVFLLNAGITFLSVCYAVSLLAKGSFA